MLRRDCDRGLSMLPRLEGAAEALLAQCQQRQRVGIAGLELDRPLEATRGFLEPSQDEEIDRAHVVCGGIVRRHRDGALEESLGNTRRIDLGRAPRELKPHGYVGFRRRPDRP